MSVSYWKICEVMKKEGTVGNEVKEINLIK